MNFSKIWRCIGELGVTLNLYTKFDVFLVSVFQKLWDCEEFAFHRQRNIIFIKAIWKLSKPHITFILAILFNQPFNAQFYNLRYTYWLAIPMLHYSQIFYWPWLLTIYHQVTLKNYLETVLWCKGAFYISDWTVFISIWLVGRSNSYMVDSLRMTPCAMKGIGVANL